MAILGRPNVGKSSLLNALLGRERVIVSEVPGTTRDAIDTVLRRGETTFVLVDTAGLRRKRKQRQGIEYYSELRALEAAERADVALVLIDASEGVVEQDLSVADVARKAGCSTLVVLSKWDVTADRPPGGEGLLHRRLRQRSPVIAVSAKTGRGLGRLLDHVEALFAKHNGQISTPELNRALGELREARQGPAERGRRLRLMYGTQTGVRPPRFRSSSTTRGWSRATTATGSRTSCARVRPRRRAGVDRLRRSQRIAAPGRPRCGPVAREMTRRARRRGRRRVVGDGVLGAAP